MLNRSTNHFTLRCNIEQNPYKVSVLQPILYEDSGTLNEWFKATSVIKKME